MGKSYNRPNKNVVRRQMFSGLQAKRSILTLPGRDALCVRTMLDNGIADRSTSQVWFERDQDELCHLHRMANELGVSPKIIFGDVSEWHGEETFDLVNLDLEESLSPSNGRVIENLRHKIAVEGDVLATFAAHPRNREPSEFMDWFSNKMRFCPVLGSLARDVFDSIMRRTEYSEAEISATVRTTVGFLCCLADRTTALDYFQCYSDGYPMVAIRVEVGPILHSRSLPFFSELVEEWQPTYVPASWTRNVVSDDTEARRAFLMEQLSLNEADIAALKRMLDQKIVEKENIRRSLDKVLIAPNEISTDVFLDRVKSA